MKKWFALLLVLVLCVPIVTGCGGSKTETEGTEPKTYTSGDWKYKLLKDGTADLITYTNKEATYVEIPEKLDGHRVTISETNPFWRRDVFCLFTVSPDHPNLAMIDGVLFNKAEKKLVAFPRASAVTEYAVPDGILSIGGDAFSWCVSLTAISLPESVTSIDNSAFSWSGVTQISLPESLTSIGAGAFLCCQDLTAVALPESLTSIGDCAFYACGSLTEITLPKNVTSIGAGAFSFCSALKEFHVASENPNYATVDGVLFDKAGECIVAFPGGRTQTNYTVPNGVVSIGEDAFAYCSRLNVIILPESVTSIGERSFASCVALKTIYLPKSVTSIGDLAFSYCMSMTTISLPDSVTSLGEGVFAGCSSLADFRVSTDNKYFKVNDGVLFDKAGERIIAFPAADERTDYTVPDGVITIGSEAFSGCKSLTTVTLPKSVTSIGDSAFERCNALTTITLSENVTSIGKDVFQYCEALTTRVAPNSYAEQYCKENNLPFVGLENTDWLNN